MIGALAIPLLTASPVFAGSVLDKVKKQGVVHCGSIERPGLASADGDDKWRGLNVDVCRAVAAAVLGSADKVVFQEYETPKQFEAIKSGADDLFFLSASEIVTHQLVGRVLPGPTVFVETNMVMVPQDAAEQHVADLAGQKICFPSPANVENSVNAFFEAAEMVDAYKVQFCHGMANEVTTLATQLNDGGVNNLKNRILPDALTAFPIMAATGTADAQWSAIVAWTVDTLLSAERPERHWYHGGVKALPLDGKALGLDKGWQDRVIAQVGTYGDIFERNLGTGSSLKLARGVNANQIGGGLLLGPFLE
jgi:general L-amino acid transport system substrate-binding protein